MSTIKSLIKKFRLLVMSFAAVLTLLVTFLKGGEFIYHFFANYNNDVDLYLVETYPSLKSISIPVKSIFPHISEEISSKGREKNKNIIVKTIYIKVRYNNSDMKAKSIRDIRFCREKSLINGVCPKLRMYYVNDDRLNPSREVNTIINIKDLKVGYFYLAFLTSEIEKYNGNSIVLSYKHRNGKWKKSKSEIFADGEGGPTVYVSGL